MPSATLSTTTPGSQFTVAGYPNFSNELLFEFLRELDIQRPDMIRQFYTRQEPILPNSDTMVFKSYALPEYGQVTPEGVEPALSGITEGDSLTKKFRKYTHAMPWTDEAQTFDKNQMVPKMAASMVKAINSIKDLVLTYEFFQGAPSASAQFIGESAPHETVCGDNVALASLLHTVPGTRAAGTNYITTGTLDFSRDNLATTISTMQTNCVNDNGRIVPCEPSIIFCGPRHELVRRILETLGSSFDPVTNNNTMSIYGPGQAYNMQLVVLKKGWFGVDGYRPAAGTYDYFWGLLDPSFNDGRAYAEKGGAETRVLDMPNYSKLLQAKTYMASGCVRWQGYFLQQGVA